MRKFLAIITLISVWALAQNVHASDQKRMIYGETARLNNLDPYTIHDASAYRLTDLIFDDLVTVGPGGSYQPALAESWRVEDGGAAITVKLRKNVFWHPQGDDPIKPLSVDDVVTTIRLLTNKDSEIPNSERFKVFAKTDVISKSVIKIHYKRALADPIKPLLIKILPDHILGKEDRLERKHPFNRSPVGTGPYIFSKTNPQGELLLKANHRHYNGKPHLEQIIMKPFSDQTIMAQSLLFRSLDLITYLSPKDLKEVEGDRRMQLVPYEAQSFSFIAMNTVKDPLKDKRVRQAISYAVNRAEMLEAFFGNKGHLITGPFSPSSWAYNLDVAGYKYDIDRASSLISSAGYQSINSNGVVTNNSQRKLVLRFAVPIAGESEMIKRISLAIQSYLANIGVITQLEFLDWEVWKQKVLGSQDYDMTIASWNFDDAANISSLFHSSSAKPWGNNFVGYKNTTVDSLLIEAEATNDFDKRRAIYKKLHSVLADEAPYVFLWTLQHHAAHHQRLTGVRIEPFSFFKHVNSWNIKEI